MLLSCTIATLSYTIATCYCHILSPHAIVIYYRHHIHCHYQLRLVCTLFSFPYAPAANPELEKAWSLNRNTQRTALFLRGWVHSMSTEELEKVSRFQANKVIHLYTFTNLCLPLMLGSCLPAAGASEAGDRQQRIFFVRPLGWGPAEGTINY
jgi:hypothetical protein